MASKKRTDNKGRNLRNNELQRPDGRYLYRYKAPDDKIKVVYARTLAELREKEAAIQKDLLDGINTAGNRKTLNQLFYTDFMEIKKKSATIHKRQLSENMEELYSRFPCCHESNLH